MKKLFGIFVFFIFITVFSFGQNTQEVFAPFVSRLRAVPEEGSIKLTWKDSSDIDGTYLIYRGTKEINSSTFKEAVKVGEVPQDTGMFVDYPEKRGTFYYVVLIKDTNGKIYELFIPFRNKTTKGIVLESLGTEIDLATDITDINTQIQRDAILVTFTSSKADRELIIYRSTSPISQSTDLAYAQPLRAIPSSRSSFQDFPVPGISYYYAILDSGLVKVGEINFEPGDNATIIPASISIGNRVGLPETTISRNLPLPLYPLSIEIASGKELDTPRPLALPTPKRLDSATSKSVAALLSRLPVQVPEELRPAVLPKDKGAIVSGGEEYTLKSILTREFAEKRWLEAEKLLKNFLSVHRSADIERRGRFYLGQVLYFQKEYKESFMQFLLIRDNLYTDVSPWINRLFSILTEV